MGRLSEECKINLTENSSWTIHGK